MVYEIKKEAKDWVERPRYGGMMVQIFQLSVLVFGRSLCAANV